MPTTPTYPGVYIEEVPSGVRTIVGVATSITAFVGRARKGPVNDPTTINNYGDYERIFGGLWLKSTMSYAVRDFYLNGGRQAIIVRLVNGAKTFTIRLPTGGADPNDELDLEAANPGSWGRRLRARVDHKTRDYLTPSPNVKWFNLIVEELDELGQVVATESFPNVSIDEKDVLYLPRVLEQRSRLVRVVKSKGKYVMPNVRPAVAGDSTPLSPPTSPPMSPPASPPTSPPASPVASVDEHDDGADLTDDQYLESKDGKKGIYALEKADLFNLLCIPPYTATGDVRTKVVEDAVAYCRERRAMLLVDPHSSWTSKDEAKNQFLSTDKNPIGTHSNYAALFFPRLKQPNPLRDNQVEEFVPCGAVAGVFARTDAQRGVWKAPAGQEASLAGVPQLSVPLTDDENGELNQLGINCLRAFPVYGRLVWGARTLEGADRLTSEWKYIPVRRTALFIEESLYRGTKWVVFEPNDEPLWAQIRANITAFMHDLFRQGAFQGRTPREAYLVKCDKETTTQYDIDRGIVNILVGFAPLKPAEFVFIRIQQLTQQAQA